MLRSAIIPAHLNKRKGAVRSTVQAKRAQRRLPLLSYHLRFDSPVLRFSLRIAVACLFGYLLTSLFNMGNYSYWLLLTLVFVMRPQFGFTWKRNIQRVTGTAAGVLIAIFLVSLNLPLVLTAIVLALLLMGYLCFLRLNYLVSVVCITALVILGINFLPHHPPLLQTERLLDTLFGCVISLAAVFLFPFWESRRISVYLEKVIRANIEYLELSFSLVTGTAVLHEDYLIRRAQVFRASADLSAAFKRMTKEPLHNKQRIRDLHTFQVHTHQLFSAVTAFFNNRSENKTGRRILPAAARAAVQSLNAALCCLSGTTAGCDVSIGASNASSLPERIPKQVFDEWKVIEGAAEQIFSHTWLMTRQVNQVEAVAGVQGLKGDHKGSFGVNSLM
jgi:uncharacterized membrane protein YccC